LRGGPPGVWLGGGPPGVWLGACPPGVWLGADPPGMSLGAELPEPVGVDTDGPDWLGMIADKLDDPVSLGSDGNEIDDPELDDPESPEPPDKGTGSVRVRRASKDSAETAGGAGSGRVCAFAIPAPSPRMLSSMPLVIAAPANLGYRITNWPTPPSRHGSERTGNNGE
jgi:hypothetical protein